MSFRSLQSLFGLQDQVAIVTGASSGLGVEFATALAVAGANVAILARRMDRLEQVAREISGLGVRCLPVQVDLTRQEEAERAFAEVEQELGPLDILVNNAGTVETGKAENHRREQWERVIAINQTAVFTCCQLAGRSMIAHGHRGRIINIASVHAYVADSVFNTSSYNASKGAVVAMTRHLAHEWARHNITVNAIAPGWFLTDMVIDPEIGDVSPHFKEKILNLIPLKRMGKSGELMGALVYLASPAASYVTGTTLVVDGGLLVT